MNYRMKDVMQQTGLSEKAIRLYISKSLIIPYQEKGLHRTNYHFTSSQIDELKDIALLRRFGFSIQDIKEIQSDEASKIHLTLLKNSNALKQNYELIQMWNIAPIDIDIINNKNTLIEALRNNYDMALKEKLFSCSYSDSNAEIESPTTVNLHKVRLQPIALMIVGFLIIFMLGYFMGIKKEPVSKAPLSYGIMEQSLEGSNIIWNNFPNFRTVSITLNGELKLTLPDNAVITISGIENPEDFIETSRTNMVHSDGTELIYYDIVTYNFSDVVINSDGILKENDYFKGTMSGYEIKVLCNDMEFSIGYIMPLSDELITFSEEEYSSFSYNLTYHNEIYQLSNTYLDGLPLTSLPTSEGIIIEKTDNEIFHYRIINNSNSTWQFRADIADIEMYYRGIWLKVISPYDSNLMISECAPDDSLEFLYDTDIINEYPYFIPGIYRLVVYGVDNTYITSDSFIID